MCSGCARLCFAARPEPSTPWRPSCAGARPRGPGLAGARHGHHPVRGPGLQVRSSRFLFRNRPSSVVRCHIWPVQYGCCIPRLCCVVHACSIGTGAGSGYISGCTFRYQLAGSASAVAPAARWESASLTCAAADRRPYAEKYADDQDAFFKDYAAAHKKLSENGASWVEGGPVSLD